MMLRGSGDRSRMTQMTSKGINRSITASGSARWSLKTVRSARWPSTDQSALSSAAFW
jgi:hypothetical protein